MSTLSNTGAAGIFALQGGEDVNSVQQATAQAENDQ
jgi:hypothetical protein